MEQLPGADAAFLALETPEAPAHVGGLTILDPATSPDFGFEKLVATVGRRIRLAPRLTRRLLEVPLGLDRPYLVEDPQFDVRNHIRRIAVPGPGGLRELAELVSYLHSKPLHRDRPLWELHLVEGLRREDFDLLGRPDRFPAVEDSQPVDPRLESGSPEGSGLRRCAAHHQARVSRLR